MVNRATVDNGLPALGTAVASSAGAADKGNVDSKVPVKTASQLVVTQQAAMAEVMASRQNLGGTVC